MTETSEPGVTGKNDEAASLNNAPAATPELVYTIAIQVTVHSDGRWEQASSLSKYDEGGMEEQIKPAEILTVLTAATHSLIRWTNEERSKVNPEAAKE
ncbi:MAG: hypothetical protein Q7O66_02055 [Dehalococcoidia bacterium]|nr:hypothetical protein [Dehalococcoidia bacterium]